MSLARGGWQRANREPWALAASTICAHMAQGKPGVQKKGGGGVCESSSDCVGRVALCRPCGAASVVRRNESSSPFGMTLWFIGLKISPSSPLRKKLMVL